MNVIRLAQKNVSKTNEGIKFANAIHISPATTALNVLKDFIVMGKDTVRKYLRVLILVVKRTAADMAPATKKDLQLYASVIQVLLMMDSICVVDVLIL